MPKTKQETENKTTGKTSNKVPYLTRAQGDMQYLFLASAYIRCDQCKQPLKMFRMFVQTLFKKHGSPYYVRCKQCGHVNKRIRGNLKKEFNERWK